jgi:outer membrane protein TolC
MALVLGAPPAFAARYTLGTLLAKVTRESPAVIAARAAVVQKKALLLEQQMRWMPDGEAGFNGSGAPKVRLQASPEQLAFQAAEQAAGRTYTPPNTITTVVDLLRPESATLGDKAPFDAARLIWGLDLKQPLYTSGKISAAISSAKGGIGWEEGNAASAEGDIAVTVVRIYTQVRVAQIGVDAVDSTLARLHQWEAQVEGALEGKNRQGYSEADLSRIRLNITNNELSRLDQVRNLTAAREALRELVGDPEADTDDEDFAYAGSPLEAEATRDLDKRPEVWGSRAGLAYYEAWRRLHLGYMLPDVGLATGAWGGYWPTGLDDPRQSWTLTTGYIGVALREPLDLGVRAMRWQAVKHEEQMQRTRYAMGYGFWQLELLKARLDFHEAYERMRKAAKAEGVTRGWYAAVDENLTLGLYPDGREIVEVMVNWTGFRLRHAQAIADTLIALATLQRLSGEPILAGFR